MPRPIAWLIRAVMLAAGFALVFLGWRAGASAKSLLLLVAIAGFPIMMLWQLTERPARQQ